MLLFVSVPLLGHVNPMLQPARRLIADGHEVVFVGHDELAAVVAAAGVPFRSLGPDRVPAAPPDDGHHHHHQLGDPLATRREQLLASHERFTGWEAAMLPGLLAAVRELRPAALVAEVATLAAHDVAEAERLPLALLGSMPLSLALDLTGFGL